MRQGEGGRRRYLLVRTRRGDRWTFPKGRIDPDDLGAAAAAQREAREEAGVSGRLLGGRLTIYRHAAGSEETGWREQAVQAFLLEVEREDAPDEPWRTPRWFTADEARALFRSLPCPAIHQQELCRVIDLAEAALGDSRRDAADGLRQ